jgi:tripartite ATP-independent transporter DctP family solute receptor
MSAAMTPELQSVGRRDFVKLVGAAGATVLAGAGGIRPARAQAKTTVRVATIQQKSQESFLVLTRWGDEVKKRSNGAVEVTVTGAEALPGGERDALEGVRALGVYDACSITTSLLSTVEPRYGLPDLPFIFKDRETAFKVHDGKIGKALDEMLLKTAGLRPLMHTYGLMRHTHLRSKAIKQVSDFAGVKIRTIQADIPLRMFKALGANPVPMAAPEVYTAIQTGVIDGWETPLDADIAWKTMEVAKFTSLTGHQYADVVLCISDRFFQGLPKNVQALLVDTANDLVGDHRKRMTAVDTDAAEKLKAAGVTITDITDKKPFQNAVEPIYSEVGKRLNILDMIQEVRSM